MAGQVESRCISKMHFEVDHSVKNMINFMLKSQTVWDLCYYLEIMGKYMIFVLYFFLNYNLFLQSVAIQKLHSYTIYIDPTKASS